MTDRISTLQSLELRDLLAGQPRSYDALVSATGIGKPRVARWVKNNRASLRIADWAPDKNGRLFVPMFEWGVGEDLPRPGRVLTPAEQMRKVRERRAAALPLNSFKGDHKCLWI